MKPVLLLFLLSVFTPVSGKQQPETVKSAFSRLERILNKTTGQQYMDYLGVTRIVLSVKCSENGIVQTERKKGAKGAAGAPMELQYTNIPWKDMEIHRVIGDGKARTFVIWFKTPLNQSYAGDKPFPLGIMHLVVMKDDAAELETLVDTIKRMHQTNQK